MLPQVEKRLAARAAGEGAERLREELVEQEWGEDEDESETFACPVSKCEGSVFLMEAGSDYDDSPAYWWCDCCDSKWLDKKNLMKEVDAIIKKYPYRAKLYKPVGGAWNPVEWEGDITEYCELVEKEAKDRKAGRQRG